LNVCQGLSGVSVVLITGLPIKTFGNDKL
jgi:hypothetical protein